VNLKRHFRCFSRSRAQKQISRWRNEGSSSERFGGFANPIWIGIRKPNVFKACGVKHVRTKRAIEGIVWWEGWGQYFLRDLIRVKPFRTWRTWNSYASQRGMSPWHDVVDWAGGFPFEVAKPEQVFAFYLQRGFALKGLKTCGGGKGCNEFLFIKG